MGYFKQPSETIAYEKKYCRRCYHGQEGRGCAVMTAHLSAGFAHEDPGSALHLLIPVGARGQNLRCRMFIRDRYWHPLQPEIPMAKQV